VIGFLHDMVPSCMRGDSVDIFSPTCLHAQRSELAAFLAAQARASHPPQVLATNHVDCVSSDNCRGAREAAGDGITSHQFPNLFY
jgi:hypothetical protein